MKSAADTTSASDFLSTALAERTGLSFGPHAPAEVSSRITKALRRSRTTSAQQYLERVATDTRELDTLLLDLTVGETFFFRDDRQFELLRQQVLPDIAAAHAGPLRIWSAGCATGEEPYSVSMMLHESGLSGRARVVGTDLCRGRLDRASRGRYSRWSLRRTSPASVDRYFNRIGSEFEVRPSFRSGVTFRPHNLADESDPVPWHGEADLVICRNVLIYFQPQLVAGVFRRLLSALRPGGWLIMGASDPLAGDIEGCDVVVTAAGVVYRRTPIDDSAAITPTAPLPDIPARELPVSANIENIFGNAVAPAVRPSFAGESPPTHTTERPHRPVATEVAPHHRIFELVRSGSLDAAGRLCAEGLERTRAEPVLHYLHAVLLLASGNHREAGVAARRVVYLDRESPLGHLVLARVRTAVGDVDRARRSYENAERLLVRLPRGLSVGAVEAGTAAELLRVVRASLAALAS